MRALIKSLKMGLTKYKNILLLLEQRSQTLRTGVCFQTKFSLGRYLYGGFVSVTPDEASIGQDGEVRCTKALQ